jgi:aminoglycoside 6'-N-acetyltransferase I
MPRFIITDLDPADEPAIHHIAEILVAGFKRHWPRAWPDLASALEEVRESFGEGLLSRVARDAGGQVLGWIGGVPPLCH